MEPIYQAPSAEIYGEVSMAEGVSVWSNVVMRAESNHIEIGAYTNIQDFTMIHVGSGPTRIGAYCSITHHCTIHGATIGDNCLIGINATIMDNAVIGANSIVAGHCIVNEGTVIPENSIVAGVPGKVLKSNNNYIANRLNAMMYFENGKAYTAQHYRRWADDDIAELAERWRAQFTTEMNSL